MHEIIKPLAPTAFVLDLGCATGSFPREATQANVIRFDRDIPHPAPGNFVQGDSAALPFADAAFDAIISNHSLEHLDNLDASLQEIGRVLRPQGALFVSVPDSSTFTDKLYRWLARGGGHVNAFTSPDRLATTIERATGLPHRATRTLCSSLSFLNRRNSPRPRPRRLLPLGAGYEWSLFLYVWASRRLDRWLHLRTGVYGWALYFGAAPGNIDTATSVNVCIRCGSGIRSALLKPFFRGIQVYRCPQCGATNPFAEDV
jgi:SAM-dependent methyltransferase